MSLLVELRSSLPTVLLALTGLGAASPAFARQDDPSSAAAATRTVAPRFSQRLTTSQYVTMRDGVRLAVSITMPADGGQAAPGPFPVIWQHALDIAAPGLAANDDDQGLRAYGRVPLLAHQGYVVVQVARRGNSASFGTRRGYNDRTEAFDAYEVIDWLAQQPWSTGAVGVYGCSNTGDAAMNAVSAGNPNLKAAWAGAMTWERYDGFFRGGIMANWGTGPQASIELDMKATPVQGDEARTLLRQAAEEHQGATPLLELWQGMPFRDSQSPLVQSRFWYETSVASYRGQLTRAEVPVYLHGGWFDDLRQPSLVALANLPGERRMLIGPWAHCQADDFDMIGEMARFFGQHLKGTTPDASDETPLIRYFTINAPVGAEWRETNQWPPAGVAEQVSYLSGSSLSPAPASAPPVSFTVRYDVDCPVQGGRETSRSLPGRNDGTNPYARSCFPAWAGPHFLSGPLDADTEVTGSPVADIWISSSAADANVFVYLEDVAPDGAATVVADGRLKASLRSVATPNYAYYGLPWHRAHAEDAAPLVPGEPARLQIELLPTSYVFKAGHRMRVTIAGADYRERSREPVSPAPVLTILNEQDYRSTLTLPVIAPITPHSP